MTVFKGTIQGSSYISDGSGTYVTVTLTILETLRGSVDTAGNGNFTYSANGTVAAVAHYPNGATGSYSYPINYGGPLVTNIHNFQQTLGGTGGAGITLTGFSGAGTKGPDGVLSVSGEVPIGYYPNGYPKYLRMAGTLLAYGGYVGIAGPYQTVTRPTSASTDMTFTVNRYYYLGDTDQVSWSVIGELDPYAYSQAPGAIAASPADFVGITLPSGTINFAPGQTSAAVTVHVAGLPALAATSEFAIQLSSPSPGVRLQNTTVFGTIASATTLAAGAVLVAGAGADVVSLQFADATSAAPALTVAGKLNARIFSGGLQPVSLTPGSPIPALSAGAQGALAVHSGGGTIALPLGYVALATDAPTPLTVLGGPLDGQVVLAGSGGLAFNAGAGSGTVIATGGNNLVSAYPGAGNQDIQLGAGDDTIVALGGSNTISAGAGRNVILLGGGNNVLTTTGSDLIAEAGAGMATINAGAGDIAAFLAAGHTNLDAGTGRATVVAGSGDVWAQVSTGSQVWLGTGNATVQENVYDFVSGALTVIGGAGNASINLRGPGDLVFAGSGSTDLTDDALSAATVVGGSGPMTLRSDYGGLVALSFAATTFEGNGANTVAAFAGSLTVTGGNGVFLGGPAGHNVLTGGWQGSAILIGGGDGDVLTAGAISPYGLSGQDALVAGPGAETLTGAGTNTAVSFYAGPGADLMVAGNGPSQMLDGTGAATMVGGSGLDLFAFAQGHAAAVTIQAFNPSLNYLSLIGFPAGEAAAALAGATASGGNESLLLSDGTHITFQGFTGLSAANFL